MTDVTFATCVYDDLHATEFAGRQNRGTHYAFSLAQIHKLGAPIYCFTDKANMQRFFPALYWHGIDNFKFVNYNLNESPYHSRIQQVKSGNPEIYIDGLAWRQRCVEIMWAKFDWLIYVLEDYGSPHAKDKFTFWIDGGLSHEGILPKKYNSIHGTKPYSTSAAEYHDRFFIDKIFNPELPNYLLNFMGDSDLMAFFCNQPQHNDPSSLPPVSQHYIGTIAGGLFGGRNSAVYELAKECQKVCEQLLATNCILKEEDILTYVINRRYAENPEREHEIKLFTFKTWYHEDWNVYRPNDSSFSDFFKDMI